MENGSADMPAPPPIIIAPFTARGTTYPTDSDYDLESSSGRSAIMTPPSPSTLPEVVPDLPPSYEEAQAELLRAHGGDGVNIQVHRIAIASDPLVSLPDQCHSGTPEINRTPTRRANTTQSADAILSGTASPSSPHDPTAILLHQALDFTHHPSEIDVRFTPRLSSRVAVPRQTHFVRAYSKVLRTHGIRPAEFVAFVDGLNTLSSVSATPRPTKNDPSSDPQDLVQAYLASANSAYFAPRGLKVSIQTLPTLLSWLPLAPEPSARVPLVRKLRAVKTPITEKAKALEPYIAPLTYDVPKFSASILTLRVMAARLAPVPPEFVPLEASHQTAAPPIPTKSPLRHRHDSATEAWDEWGQRLGRYWEQWGRRAEGWGKRAEDWGHWVEDRSAEFGKRTEGLGEEFGRRCEEWGEGLGRRVSMGSFLGGRAERQWGGLRRPRGSWDGGRSVSSPSAGELGLSRTGSREDEAVVEGAKSALVERVGQNNVQALEAREKSKAEMEAKRAKQAAKEARKAEKRAEKLKMVERTRGCGSREVTVEEVDKNEEEEEEEVIWIVVENLQS